MCGIIGYAGKNIEKEQFESARDSLIHRGPDGFGAYYDLQKGVALGHRRLSIIDLSDAANQPMISNDGRYAIIFNGEIFNYPELKKELSDYPFSSQGDTEVLLAAFIKWGKGCLNKLNGQFAFAIYDKQKGELFCARDHFGIKPFFYFFENGIFIFASEIKALFKLGLQKKPNDKMVNEYLKFGLYDHSDETFFQDIKSLSPGHFLVFKEGKIKIEKYWDLADIPEREFSGTREEAEDRLRELIEDAVRLQLRSDVPVGFNLSSGLDSGVLYYFSKSIYGADGHNLHLFTARLPDGPFDEGALLEQRLTLDERVRWHTATLTPEKVDALAKELMVIEDQPYGGYPTIQYYNLYKETAGVGGVKVLLEGQGMDELLAGYSHYGSLEKLDERFPKPFVSTLRNAQYRDIRYTKLPRVLRFNDHISMAFGKELRVPFLDRRLAEFCFLLPDRFKIENGKHKSILRSAMEKYLSSDIKQNPKIQFGAFQTVWLGKDLGESSFSLWQEINIKLWKQKFFN